MARITIKDVAKEAGVSVSTVNRLLKGEGGLKGATAQAIKDAASKLGYHGLRTIDYRLSAQRPKFKFGFLLLQPTRTFYKMLGAALEAAAARSEMPQIETHIVFAEDISPDFFASKLLELGETCDAIGIVAPVHRSSPKIAVNSLQPD